LESTKTKKKTDYNPCGQYFAWNMSTQTNN
jgi:hypothetical protein